MLQTRASQENEGTRWYVAQDDLLPRPARCRYLLTTLAWSEWQDENGLLPKGTKMFDTNEEASLAMHVRVTADKE